jgi:DNA-binding transcriptional LysR family regulator
LRLDALTLKQLRALSVVTDTGSLTLAAERLNQTPPAIHSQIKNLEAATGQTLLQRASDGSGFHATQAGREMVIAAQRIEAVLSHAARQIAALSQGRTGHVVLGTVSTAKYFAPRLVRLLQDLLPDVEITLQVANRSETVAALERGAFDLAIMGRPPRSALSRSVPLGPHPHGIVLPPDHPLAGRDGYDPAALLRETFLSREEGSGTRILMERFIDRLAEGNAPRLVVMASNETIKQAVLAGLGIAFLSLHTVQDEVQAGRLVLLRGAGLPVMRHWYLVPGTEEPEAMSMAARRCAAEIEALGGVYLPRITG